ncbi:MAG: MBL fold metallo-hydrolase [Promethearchaeota archaeon]
MKIIEDIFWYPLWEPRRHFLFRGFSCNVYAINQGDEIWLVDAGTNTFGRCRLVLRWMRGDGLDPEKISRILITHAHPDHVNGLNYFKKLLDPDILIYEHESEVLKYGDDLLWKLEEEAEGSLQHDFFPVPISWVKLLSRYCMGITRPVNPTDTFRGGELLKGNYHDLKIIHAPGHSAGHSCFFIPDEEVLFSGDIIGLNNIHFEEKTPLNFATADFDDYRDSLNRLMTLDACFLCSGHGKKIYKGRSIVRDMLTRAKSLLDELETIVISAFEVKNPLALSDLKKYFPKDKWPSQDRAAAPYSILKSLEKKKVVKRVKNLFYRVKG